MKLLVLLANNLDTLLLSKKWLISYFQIWFEDKPLEIIQTTQKSTKQHQQDKNKGSTSIPVTQKTSIEYLFEWGLYFQIFNCIKNQLNN